jgi:hypothetical protein
MVGPCRLQLSSHCVANDCQGVRKPGILAVELVTLVVKTDYRLELDIRLTERRFRWFIKA